MDENAWADEPELRVLTEAPITFDVADRTVHSPMVGVVINGVATKLILDTGSTAHVLTTELVDKVGLTREPSEPGTDHAGVEVSSWSVGEVSVQVGDLNLPLRDVVSIAGPPPFDGWGVGGFLSPQSLHPSATIVLDFVGNKVGFIEATTAGILEHLKQRFPALNPLVLAREPGESVRVSASVEPFSDVPIMLNTGTSETEFARTAVPGLRGAQPDETGLGISGAEVPGEVAKDQVLVVGGVRLELPVLFVRESMPPEHPDGQVGMDLLSGTVLALSPRLDEPVLWLVPLPLGYKN